MHCFCGKRKGNIEGCDARARVRASKRGRERARERERGREREREGEIWFGFIRDETETFIRREGSGFVS